MTVAAGNVCQDVRIALGGSGPKPRRAVQAEAELRGKTLNSQAWQHAASRRRRRRTH
jgi:CO/xanthine dehydrogenase FAD-binding subunit